MRDAVIVVLGLALLPVLGHFYACAREKAQQRECMANLRMIGQAIQLYETDYEAIMPWGSGGSASLPSSNWLDLLDPYIHLTVHMRYSHGKMEGMRLMRWNASQTAQVHPMNTPPGTPSGRKRMGTIGI